MLEFIDEPPRHRASSYICSPTRNTDRQNDVLEARRARSEVTFLASKINYISNTKSPFAQSDWNLARVHGFLAPQIHTQSRGIRVADLLLGGQPSEYQNTKMHHLRGTTTLVPSAST